MKTKIYLDTYKNDYDKKDDEMLWEIHEIRNEIHKTLTKANLKEFNLKAKKILEERRESKKKVQQQVSEEPRY